MRCPMSVQICRFTISALVLSCVVATSGLAGAQTTTRPGARGQTPPKPAAPQQPARTQRPPAQPAAKPAEAPPPPTPPPPKPVAQDLRMKTIYTANDNKTESVTFRKGERERFEFGDVVLLRQHDLKRTVQIMRGANTYMVVADGN